MFQIFTKNEYLVDQFQGFVDIHNHILPGIDDGAKNVEESIELLRAFENIGVTEFICTPHIMHNYYDNTPKIIKKAFTSLQKELKKQGAQHIDLKYAAEHMIDANFESILEEYSILPLDSEHLLIEMSYLQPSINFDEAVRKILDKQLFPVFAHPERYVYLHDDFNKYRKYKADGLKFQLNVLSLFGYYGKGIQKIALKLLKEDCFDFIGTDAHSLRHIEALKSGKIRRSNIYLVNKLIIQTIEQFKKV